MKKILIVDNDPGMCKLMAMAFRQASIDTYLTSSVPEAADFLRGGECAAVLMDFHLGAGESGALILARWSSEGIMPPFWLVTGTPEEAGTRALSALESFQGTIAKPFSILELVSTVKKTAFPNQSLEQGA